jgi:hypothetical protein
MLCTIRKIPAWVNVGLIIYVILRLNLYLMWYIIHVMKCYQTVLSSSHGRDIYPSLINTVALFFRQNRV